MTASITLNDLESRLWDAANALRGPVDPADFKTYVFPMLFWKWISDTWEWEQDQAVKEYGDELTDEIAADFHQFDLPANTRWAQVTNTTVRLGSKVTKAFSRIEQANPKTLSQRPTGSRAMPQRLHTGPRGVHEPVINAVPRARTHALQGLAGTLGYQTRGVASSRSSPETTAGFSE